MRWAQICVVLAAGVGVWSGGGAVAGEAERPPKLRFNKPVDYVRWYNGVVVKPGKKNAYDLYKGLFPGKDGNGGIPAMPAAAEEEYQRVRLRVWRGEECPALAKYLEACKPYLATFSKAAEGRDYWEPFPSQAAGGGKTATGLLGFVSPGLASLATASKAMLAQGWQKQERQAEKLGAACRTVLKAAGQVQQAPTTVHGLVGTGLRSLVYQDVRAAVEGGVFEESKIGKVYEDIRQNDPGQPDLGRAVNFEWASGLEMVARLFPRGKWDAKAAEAMRQALETAGPDWTDRVRKSKPEKVALRVDEAMERLRRVVAGPPMLVKLTDIRMQRALVRDPEAERAVAARLMPDFGRAYETMLRAEVERRATLLMLALQAYHAKHRQWPDVLGKLTDRDLGLTGVVQVQEDPYAGVPLRYLLKDGRPVLYSLGADQKDDGGRHDAKWGEEEKGGDFVFWPVARN